MRPLSSCSFGCINSTKQTPPWLMQRLVGVEVDNGQTERVVLHHPWLDLVGKGKSDGGRQIFAPHFLIASGCIDDALESTNALYGGLSRFVMVTLRTCASEGSWPFSSFFVHLVC